jgi:type IV secretory pathway VirB2 component (pilin)
MRTLATLLLFLSAGLASAQNAAPSWLEQTLYGNGKINVVVAVVAVIILGLGLWMWRIDRKIGRLEEQALKKP